MVARQRKNDPTHEIQPFNSQDKEWVPSVHDKHLDVHEVYTNMVPVMLRRGISCATMVDVFRVFHHSIVSQGQPLTATHRLLSEKEMRTAVNKVRAQFISSLGQLEFNGKN